MKAKIVNYTIALLGLIPLLLWAYHYINWDLWYDEAYSLEHFALTSLNTTVFYYPAPNNHIFFNLTTQLISRITGLRDVFEVADHVYIFRGFQLLVSLLTAYYSLLIIRRFFNYKSSFLVGVLLFTTIPYMNFAMQLRGYNMSSLFLIMIIFYSWNYVEFKKKSSLIMILLCSVLILYTIPSNLYVLAAFGLVQFLFWVYYYKKGRAILTPYFMVLVFLVLGVVVSVLLYAPILEDVIFNKYSNRSSDAFLESFSILKKAIPAFLSARYLLLLLIIPGIYLFFKKSSLKEKQYALTLAALFVFPFVLSFLHQKSPFGRVFVPLAPVFCLLAAVLMIKFTDNFTEVYKTRILQIVVTFYCTGIFINEMNKNNDIVSRALVDNNKMTQNLYRNFYLADFYRQDSTMKYLSSIHNGAEVVQFKQEDKPSTELYLRKYSVPFTKIDSIEALKLKLQTETPLYILTSYKNNTLEALDKLQGVSTEVLTNPYSFTNIIKVELDEY